jgi:hypothetical protein
MKKLGLIIAFCGLFAIGLSAQDPQKPKKQSGKPTPVATVNKKTPKNTVPTRHRVIKKAPQQASKPAEKKSGTAVNPN